MMGRRFTAEDVDLIRTLTEAGGTDTEIAVRIGRSADVVSKKRQAAGIPAGNSRRYTDDEVIAIGRLVKAGKTNREIALQFDRSPAAISNRRIAEGFSAPKWGPSQIRAAAKREAHIAMLSERKRKRDAEFLAKSAKK